MKDLTGLQPMLSFPTRLEESLLLTAKTRIDSGIRATLSTLKWTTILSCWEDLP